MEKLRPSNLGGVLIPLAMWTSVKSSKWCNRASN